jgi:hypothetical protein
MKKGRNMTSSKVLSRKHFTALVILVGAALCALLMALGPAHAHADENTSVERTNSSSSGVDLFSMGNDRIWAGESLNLDTAEAENDLLAAGRTIQIANSTVGGSVRAAAQTIELSNTTAQENITVAGETVTVADSTANTVAMAGRTASFSGTCKSLTMYAETVFIDGIVEGDVHVGANKVMVKRHAQILGTLYVSAPSDPVMERDAIVADVVFTQTDNPVSVEDAGEVVSGVTSAFGFLFTILGIVGTVLMAVLAEWLFARNTLEASRMIRARTAAHIGSGVVGTLAAPIAIILLCVLVVTLPVAGCLVLALLAIAVAAGGFAGASLSKLAFPKLGRFVSALAGGAIVGIAEAIPILGTLVSIAAFAYLLGYVLQSIYLDLVSHRQAQQVNPTPQG